MNRTHYVGLTANNVVVAVYCATLDHILENPQRYPLPEGGRWIECKEEQLRPNPNWIYNEELDDFYTPAPPRRVQAEKKTSI
jgi:hypothetical protein